MKIKAISFLFFLLIGIIYGTSIEESAVLQKGTLELRVPQRIPMTERTLTTVFSENFEGSTSGWTITGGEWEIGAPTAEPSSAHGRTSCAGIVLGGSYSNFADARLISPMIPIPIINKKEEIKFIIVESFEIESEYDRGRILISLDNGLNWRELDSRSGTSVICTTVVDITPYAGKDIHIAFNFVSDSSIVYSGWNLYEVRIITIDPEPFTARMISLNSQNFPFIYMNVAVDTFGGGFPDLTQSNFVVYEDSILQTDYFEVIPPDTGGGIRLVDIVFQMDNSGSMGGEQAAIRNNVISFVNGLSALGVDFALGLCRYGQSASSGNPIIEDGGALTSDAEYFKNTVWGRNLVDGGTEPGYWAITSSASGFSFRPGAQKVFIEITDERPNQGGASETDALNACLNNSITLFALTKSSLYSYFTPITSATNGDVFDIYSSFDDILDYIATRVANTYVVKYSSSNPSYDGTERNVEVVVSHSTYQDTAIGSYIPGAIPRITRTPETIALSDTEWAAGTEFTIEANIVDNVVPYVISASLFYRTTGDATYNSTLMTLISGTPNSGLYRGIVPGADTQTPGLDYYLTATDGENTGSSPTLEPSNNPHQIAILPNEIPIINHTPPTTFTPGTGIDLTAEIIDTTDNLIASKLYYRKYGQLTYVNVDLLNMGGDIFEGDIPSPYVTSIGVQYYLKATDNHNVSAYYGTADYPVTIATMEHFIDEKREIIDYFYFENFYVDAENEANSYLNELELKINEGTATSTDINELKRLTLVEHVALMAYSQPAYANMSKVSEATAEAFDGLVFSAVTALLFGDLKKVLEPFKDIPIIGSVVTPIYNFADDISSAFLSIAVDKLAKPFALDLAHNVEILQMAHGVDQGIAVAAGNNAYVSFYEFLGTFLKFLEQKGAKETIENIVGVRQYVATGIMKLYESFTNDHIKKPLINPSYSYVNSIADIQSQSIPLETEIIISNATTYDEVNLINEGVNTASIIIAISSVIVLALALILTIPACGSGIGCILTALNASALVAAVSTLNTLFTVAKISAYLLATSHGGLYILSDTPNNLKTLHDFTYQTTSTTRNEISSRVHINMIPMQISSEWVDSLDNSNLEVTNMLGRIRSYIDLDSWSQIDSLTDSLETSLIKVANKKSILNTVLNKVHDDYSLIGSYNIIDSLYYYATAYSIASDVSNSISKFAINFGCITNLTDSEKDTLKSLIDESVSRINNTTQSYRSAFQHFDSLDYYIYPTVAFTSYSIIEKKPDQFLVQCKIMNISNVLVHNVHVSINNITDLPVSISSQTDTIFASLNPREEMPLNWIIKSYGADNIILLDLKTFPSFYPADFQGDRCVLSSFVSSPPTSSPLSDENIYAYPNPFNPDKEYVKFRFRLGKNGNVSIKVYDVSQKLVANVITDEPMHSNVEQYIAWDGKNSKGDIVANGTYFYVIESSSGEKATGKVSVLR